MNRKLEPGYLREIGLLKHYRTVRRWACSVNNLKDADLELLIYFDCIGRFTRKDYKSGTLDYSWDKRRWMKFIKDGWIVVWRKRNHTTQKYNIYKTSFKTSLLINKIYKILLGLEDLPTSERRNPIMKKGSYIDKVKSQMILNVNKDKSR